MPRPATSCRRRSLERVKSPYPSTQDPGYEKALREDLAALTSDTAAPVRELVDLGKVRTLLESPQGGTSLESARAQVENVLQVDQWLRRYRPTLAL